MHATPPPSLSPSPGCPRQPASQPGSPQLLPGLHEHQVPGMADLVPQLVIVLLWEAPDHTQL